MSTVSGSFFLRNCCCQEKSSCASLCFLKIVPSYHVSLGCSPTARPDESMSPKQTIESHTLSPQIGKDCFKPGQTHLLHKLKQLAARFFSCFSCFLGIFFILQIQLVTAHFVACPSDAAITPWNYVLFVWLLVQRHLYLQDLMQRLV